MPSTLNTTTAKKDAADMLRREVALRGPQTRDDTLGLARFYLGLAHADVDPADVVRLAVDEGLLIEQPDGGYDIAAPCPDQCPVCGANLKRQGHPQAHQHATTGEVCTFGWDSDWVVD